MSVSAQGSRSPTRWDLPVLGVLAVLSFAVIPIGVTTIYGRLPAHPLFVHVPVIFIALAAIGGLVLAARPQWYVAEHSDAAGTLRISTVAFVGFYLIALAIHATAQGQSSGVAVGDRIFARVRRTPVAMVAVVALRVITALLALGCLFYVYRTGDLGAKAVWYARLHHGSYG